MSKPKFSREIEPTVASKMTALGAGTDEDLIQICRDPTRLPEERALACLILGQIQSRAAVSVLLDVASLEEETRLVWQSLAAVGAVGSRTATRPLMRLIRTTTSWFRRQAAVFALGHLHDERARSLLIKVLIDAKEVPKTRAFAAEALGLLLPTQQTLKVLIEALEDMSIEIRYSALCGIAALRSKAALPALKDLLSDRTIIEGERTIADHAAKVINDIEDAARRSS